MSLSSIANDQTFRRLLDEANRANASFYPINPAGLEAPVTVEGVRGVRDRTDNLMTLAENTDGVPVVHTNDLGSGLKRIVDDLSSYYLLGYYSNGKLDGGFHPITVRVKRPGIRVRARRGYLAATPESATAAMAAPPRVDADAAAAASALASLSGFAREVPLRVHAAAGWKPDGTAGIWAVVEAGADWKAGGDADVMLTTAAGAAVMSSRGTFAAGTRAFRVGFAPERPLEPGDYVIRVRARASDASGTSNETMRVTVPPPPGISGAVIVRRTGTRETPTADLRFRRSEQIRVEIPLASDEAVTARLLDRAGKPLAIPVASAVRADPDGARWHTAQLALAPLGPGDYLIELSGGSGLPTVARSAEVGGGGTETRKLVAFRVVP